MRKEGKETMEPVIFEKVQDGLITLLNADRECRRNPEIPWWYFRHFEKKRKYAEWIQKQVAAYREVWDHLSAQSQTIFLAFCQIDNRQLDKIEASREGWFAVYNSKLGLEKGKEMFQQAMSDFVTVLQHVAEKNTIQEWLDSKAKLELEQKLVQVFRRQFALDNEHAARLVTLLSEEQKAVLDARYWQDGTEAYESFSEVDQMLGIENAAEIFSGIQKIAAGAFNFADLNIFSRARNATEEFYKKENEPIPMFLYEVENRGIHTSGDGGYQAIKAEIFRVTGLDRKAYEKALVEREAEKMKLPNATPIEALKLSVRAYRALYFHKVKFISQLEGVSKEKLLGMRSVGAKTADEILQKLEDFQAGRQ